MNTCATPKHPAATRRQRTITSQRRSRACATTVINRAIKPSIVQARQTQRTTRKHTRHQRQPSYAITVTRKVTNHRNATKRNAISQMASFKKNDRASQDKINKIRDHINDVISNRTPRANDHNRHTDRRTVTNSHNSLNLQTCVMDVDNRDTSDETVQIINKLIHENVTNAKKRDIWHVTVRVVKRMHRHIDRRVRRQTQYKRNRSPRRHVHVAAMAIIGSTNAHCRAHSKNEWACFEST